MRNPYYVLWADHLCRGKENKANGPHWALKGYCYLTFINAINFATVLIWLRILDIWIPPEDFGENSIFSAMYLGRFFEFILWFATPFIIINYIFVMHNKRYIKIMEKYGKSKRFYSLWYSLGSLLFGFATIMIYGVTINFGF